MRKLVGPFLKGAAYLFSILLIAAGVFASGQLSALGLAESFQLYVIIGSVVLGFIFFLILYGYGQAISSLVRIESLEARSRSALLEILDLMRAQSYPAEDSAYPAEGPAGPAYPQEPPPSAAEWRRDMAPLARAPQAPSKIACSLCGTVQPAGRSACIQCGSSFAR